ncbi:YdeI/OmpD-associated family protein [Pseudonocardia sp. GCM10023141]|uniref:YdeI/OmpD-associated family protein n=1 Tax=Pseudonocardia sp. GCM10023141 TaxID=3252653 RepID=UPI00361CA86B
MTVPDDLAAALAADPRAKAAFDALTYSNQRAHVLAVEGAKAAATRARRVEKVIATVLPGS